MRRRIREHRGKHRDPNGTWVSIYGAIATIAWNTRMVKPTEAPKDWKDLLDPRWKGRKIGLPVEAFQWYGGMVTYLGDKAGRDYMKALAAQDPQTQQGYTNTSNLLTAGEFPVAITRAHRIEDARAKARRWIGPPTPIRSSSASIRSAFRKKRRTRRRRGYFTTSSRRSKARAYLPKKASSVPTAASNRACRE